MMRWITVLIVALLAWTPIHAAEFKWMDESGSTFALDSLKGKPVLIHFWASWCPSCREEMPAFAQWVSSHPQVNTLSVSLDQKAANATAFLNEAGINMPLLLTDENQARKLGAQALPTTIIIDANGEISQLHRGPRDWSSKAYSDQLLKSLLPEAQNAPLHVQY
ncbi:TlpA disulfide reductase family protein [Mariprofundus sp. KV]|uniref:TlpA family protein disulfide reductase n=1 Tax=Mariprofundus sp. KV TaxID=2608715 RepID=UPI0015A00EA8|nr:TlpA disulfide reductase family protein [Mariprofundus sp. KV]NWF37496.1 TlpA family protein disulfide reductase [Mariprofundus sp. KV]